MLELGLTVLACGASTYLWRGLGVLLSGRVRVESEIFTWVGCVAYAMVAALISSMVFVPAGTLAATTLVERLLACATALAVYYASRRNLFAGIVAGFAVIVACNWLRGGSL
ncbi:MAG: AzlD domain-containing protein [Burkholderiales bacterium]